MTLQPAKLFYCATKSNLNPTLSWDYLLLQKEKKFLLTEIKVLVNCARKHFSLLDMGKRIPENRTECWSCGLPGQEQFTAEAGCLCLLKEEWERATYSLLHTHLSFLGSGSLAFLIFVFDFFFLV